MTVLTVIAAPPCAPQVLPTAQPPLATQSILGPEGRILQAVRSSEPIHIWKLLNRLVEEEAPPNRLETRRRKLALWKLVNRLLRRQALFRAGRHAVTTTKPSPGLAICPYPARGRRKARRTQEQARGRERDDSCGKDSR